MDTDTVYRFDYGDGAHWRNFEEYLDEKPSCDYNSTELNTENGVSVEAYTTATLDVENGSGGTTKQQFKNSNNSHLLNDKIKFEKTSYTTRMGTAEEETITATIQLEQDYDENLKASPVIAFDAPTKIKGNVISNGLVLSGKKIVCGSIVRDFSTDPLPSNGILKISTPGIASDMPATVINGDGEACPDLNFSYLKILPSEQSISVFVTKAITGMARITYSYWANY